MSDSLFVLAMTGLVISLLRLLVFAYLWRRESAEHLRLWTLGFTVQTLSQLTAVPGLLGHRLAPLQALTIACAFVATFFLLRGTAKLTGSKPDWRWWAGGLAGLAGVSAVFAASGSLLIATVVPMLFLTFSFWSMGLALFRRRHEMSGLGVSLTIFALSAIGVHFLDFPFLAEVSWFVPWGIGIALCNDVTLTVGLVVLTFDRSHAARTQADARYAELADTIGVGTYVAATTERFTEVNGALVRMLGYASAAELLAVGLDSLSLTPLPPGQHVLDMEAVPGSSATWRRKDGRPLVVQLHSRVTRDADGKVLGCRGFVVDRTAAHAVEEALIRTQKLDAVGRLAGGVAHDFNNLLTIILSSLELLALKPGDASLIGDAMEATDQAAQLIRRLLAIGRKQTPRAAPVEVSATALRTVEMLSRSLGRKHRIGSSGVTPDLWITIDPGQLEQVLVNLVLNAKDAMNEGGLIEVTSRPLTRAGLSGVELAVKDPGHGMTPEQQARIFEPFFTTREPGRGTGLGLSTVHSIVTQAGGHVDVESAPGRGSRFALWFPQTAAPAPVPQGPVASPGKRVLVVDDEPGIRSAVCRMLEVAGHTTREAASGNQAIALVRAGERFDVVLCDVRMADGDGAFTAKQLRAIAPGTRVILMSGYEDQVDEATKASAELLLAKPFTRAVLMSAIDH
ncbi:MAG: ATP-binding protein [Archangium sp.]|nr:ATP-binding protein [Archangium sp.]MDP3158038.1 ATP-binding protein [Archangium sp.]MDP3570556.1 ATP-binding protein [Archangium sp.]